MVQTTCVHCKKPVPSGAPGGLCPECMIRVGMDSGAGEPAQLRKKPEPPRLEEIIAAFPQLDILELVGSGGMGIVYKARQRSLNRIVALKILPTEDDPGFAERFTREAQSLARLNHPNIVSVHEFGELHRFHYFIMEFVEGLNLRELQKRGELSERDALAIIPQICEALQYAHDEGIIHRDIKPENVLVDRKGRVKIADFGLARILRADHQHFRLTEAREVVGTPHYMAPEQIERPQEVDHRADIYSLGVVFYELLTGELPLGRFAPPSERVAVDSRLDPVVLRALEKEPARRFQHVSEVQTRLETLKGERSDQTAAAAPPPQANPPVKNKKKLQIVAALGVFCACVVAWAVWPNPDSALIAQWNAEGDGRDNVSGTFANLTNVTFANGIRGKAFRFAGNGSVNVPRSPRLNPGQQLTIEFWMKADPENKMNDCCQGLVTADFYGIGISPGYTTRSGINFFVSTDGGATMVDTATAVRGSRANGGAVVISDRWHHVAGTYDGTHLQLYLNGNAWGIPRPLSGLISPIGPRSFLTIGSEDGKVDDPGNCVGNRYFKGLIDEVSLFKRALSPEEIQRRYQLLAGPG